MRSKQSLPLMLHPELWAGCAVDFDAGFNEALKGLVPAMAWDPLKRARWFPISNLANVKQLIREHKLASDSALDQAHRAIQEELNRRQAVKRSTPAGGSVEESTLAADYALLCIHPNAPKVLVDWSIIYWRKAYENIAVPGTQMLLLEEAYQRICAAFSGGDLGRG